MSETDAGESGKASRFLRGVNADVNRFCGELFLGMQGALLLEKEKVAGFWHHTCIERINF